MSHVVRFFCFQSHPETDEHLFHTRPTPILPGEKNQRPPLEKKTKTPAEVYLAFLKSVHDVLVV